MNVYDLTPANSQKSFYGKAKVIECEKCTILISYATPVILKDKSGSLFRFVEWVERNDWQAYSKFLWNSKA